MYGIWKYFSKEARQVAAQQEYRPHPRSAATLPCPVDRNKYCPIDHGLNSDNIPRPLGTRRTRPRAPEIANALLRAGRITEEEYDAVSELARRFTSAWDQGYIDDLWKAVGLKKKEQP